MKKKNKKETNLFLQNYKLFFCFNYEIWSKYILNVTKKKNDLPSKVHMFAYLRIVSIYF